MTALLFKMIFRLLASLPLRWVHGLGALLGRITYTVSPKYAARTRENLRQSQLAVDDTRFASLLAQTVAEAGKGLLEVPWIWGRPPEQVCMMVKSCTGWEHVETGLKFGKGIIFLTPHWGCFEVTGVYIGQRLPLTNLYRSPRQTWLEDVMRNGRQRGLARLATADVNGVRLLYKALKRGEAIGLLPDQVPSKGEGVWVDFFARPAYTMTLSGRIAESSGALVLLACAERLPHGAGYNLSFEPLLLDFSEPVPAQINAALERVIAVSPAQYLWSYNRYKIPPPAAGEQPC